MVQILVIYYHIAIEKERIAQLKTAADFNREAEEKKKAEEEKKAKETQADKVPVVSDNTFSLLLIFLSFFCSYPRMENLCVPIKAAPRGHLCLRRIMKLRAAITRERLCSTI